MLILLAPGLLFATAAAVIILRAWRPRFRFGWLSAVASSAVAWLIVWLWHAQLPLSISLPFWRISDLSPTSPTFAVDDIAWVYAASLVTLALGSLLTAPARETFPSSSSWATTLGLTGLALLAVTAANPITLLLIWAALDLLELAAMLRWTKGQQAIGRAIGVFSVRASGSLVLMLAQVVGAQPGTAVDFHSMPAQADILLLIAAALHVGVLPFPLPYFSETALRRGTGTTMRMVSAAASLILLSRIQPGSIAAPAAMVILLLCGAAAAYASWMWLRAPDEISGRSFWIIGLACLSIASVLQGNPSGAAGWGVALLLTGGILFLSSVQHVMLSRMAWIGAWTLSTLPFSLTASAWTNQTGVLNLALPVFIISQGLLLAGYLRRAARPSIHVRLESQPSWIRSIYPAGIWILLAVQLLLGLWGWSGAGQFGAWLAGGAALLVTLGLLWIIPRAPALNPIPMQELPRYAERSLDWLYRTLTWVSRGGRALTVTISKTLEGDAGIMWSLVLLILFISLIARGGR